MNKSDLVDVIAQKAGLTKKDCELALNATLEAVQEAVAAGDDVTLVGFGSFKRRKRAARSMKHPRTGETINVPETHIPVFKAGKPFKDDVAGK